MKSLIHNTIRYVFLTNFSKKIFSFLIIFLGFAFLPEGDSSSPEAQVSIQGKIYPDLLVGEGEEDPKEFGEGGFVWHSEDFIVTTGKLWEGEPPPSQGNFQWEEETIENSGKFNNRAVDLILTNQPKNREIAKSMLETGLRFDPRFFPFRYNYGRLLEIEKDYENSLRQFEYAKNEIPQYFRTYIHIGILSEWLNEPYYAIQSYKSAAKLNPWDTQALVLLADYYMKTGLRNRAKIYLESALQIEDGSPNARLGFARLEYNSGNFHKAYMILSKTQLYTPEGKEKRYDKKFHFYFAETASRVQDYETAESEYNKLLEHPNDPFFSNFSIKVVERRRNIAKKFSDIKKTGIENSDNESL